MEINSSSSTTTLKNTNIPWVEKYRPNHIDEIILEDCASIEIAYKNSDKELIPYWNSIWGRIHLEGFAE